MFVLTLRSLLHDDAATYRALRQLLKRILRQHQFRAWPSKRKNAMPFAKKRREPEPETSEAMAALPSDKWRSFCFHYLMQAPKHGAATAAARAAGFGTPTTRPIVMARYAHRLIQDPRIQNALMEESKKMLRAHAPEAVNALLAIVRDVRHKDHVRGIFPFARPHRFGGIAFDRSPPGRNQPHGRGFAGACFPEEARG